MSTEHPTAEKIAERAEEIRKRIEDTGGIGWERELIGYLEHLLAEHVEMLRSIAVAHDNMSVNRECTCKRCTEYRTLTQKGETNGTV